MLVSRRAGNQGDMGMRKLVYACLMAALIATPANAACYQYIGCTDEDRFEAEDLEDYKCTQLWVVRNVIYYEHGYCFKTKRAINYFGNDDCEYDDAEDIEFSSIEQHNIDVIVEVEDDKGC
jgi:hypothetical protein